MTDQLVEITEYDSAWTERFDRERDRVSAVA
jgi:GrpB-like predicted nucleotidyltransferase (UPF0157 family)